MAAPAAAVAQQDAFTLEGLIVTASPTVRSVDAVANHVTLLSGDRLHALGVRSLADALRDVPGLTVVRGGSFGSVTSVFVRGAESDHTLVLVDGVQVNQAGGGFDFEAVGTDNVERVEIVRGPASALYGSDAIAGVIHVITRTGRGAPTASLSWNAGSFGRRDWASTFQAGTARAGYSVSLSRRTSDGVLAFNNGHAATIASGMARLRPDDRTEVRVSMRLTDREYHFPTDGAGAVVDRNAFTYEDALIGTIGVSRSLSERVTLEARVGVHDTDGGTDDAQDGPADTLGFFGFTSLNDFLRATADVRAHVTLPGGVATLGYEFEQERQRSFTASESEFGPSSGRSQSRRNNHAAYAHVSGGADAIAISLGVRGEENERFGRSGSWQLGVSWLAVPRLGTRLRASAGSAIKEPTFFENFATGFAVGNPELAPERSRSWEVGAEQPLAGDRLVARATWFQQSLRDLIQYTFTPPEPGGPNYFNIAAAGARGLEVDVDGRFGRSSVGASWTWLKSEVVDAGFDDGAGATFVAGEPLLRRPAQQLAVRAGMAIAGFDARGTYAVTGSRSDRDFSTFPATPVDLTSYGLLTLGVTWAASGSLELEVRGENLLDADYQEVFGFPAPGRGLYIGGRLGLGGLNE